MTEQHRLKQAYDFIQSLLPYFFPSFASFAAAFIYRLYDAYNHGNIQTAFMQGSTAGYPYTHIAVGVGVVLLLVGQYAYNQKLKHLKGETKQ